MAVRGPEAIDACQALVLPGVGAFDPAMDRLRAADLVEPLRRSCAAGRPLLGICLGLQLLFEGSDEGTSSGLGLVGGRVRGLATTGPTRNVLMPDLPTVAETLPGYEASIWLGVMAPAGTPEAVIARLNTEINAFLRRPETREAQARAGAEPLVMSIAEFDAFLRADIIRQAEYIRLARITPA
jgi:hypothetical protein